MFTSLFATILRSVTKKTPEPFAVVAIMDHPLPEQLIAYAQGELFDASTIESIESHLEPCAECRRAVEDTPGDELMRLVCDSDVGQAGNLPRESPQPGQFEIPPREWQPLRLIAGYEILDEIGRGGVGVVFRARQIGLDRIVALKRLKSGVLAGRDELQRFRKEADALAALHHPNIVQIFDAGEQDGEPFLAMEFIDGQPLSSILSRSTLVPEVAAELVGRLARAVEAAHQSGMIHRDLKPANVLMPSATADSNNAFAAGCEEVTDNENRQMLHGAKIVDFGLAKFNQPEDAASTTQMWLGTPGYMAPEQADETSPSSGRTSDVYGLGAILYECLVGRPPHQGSTHLETLRQVREDEPIPPQRFQARLPLDLQTICLKCLEKTPDRRYPTAAELADDLQRFLQREPVLARSIRLPERVVRWIRRKPTAAALIAIMSIGVFGTMVGTVYHSAQLQLRMDETTAMAEIVKLEQQRADRNYTEARESVARINELVYKSWESESPEVRQLSEQLLERTTKFFESVVQQGDDGAATLVDLARSHESYGTLLFRNGKPADAKQQHRLAYDIYGSLRTREPANRHFTFYEAFAGVKYGIAITAEGGHVDTAARYIRDSLIVFERVASRDPDDPGGDETLAWAYRVLANAYMDADQHSKAEQPLRSAISVREKMITMRPLALNYQIDQGWDQRFLATVIAEIAPEKADAEFRTAEGTFKGVLVKQPDHHDAKLELSAMYLQWSEFAESRDDNARSRELHAVGRQLIMQVVQEHPDDDVARELAAAYEHAAKDL